jgi:hypothetical protein
MTQVLTIPTPFSDFSELTENFSQRVDEERLMLPCSAAIPEGEWVQFSVLLGDGEVALAGIGRVQGAFDNGEEHPPEYRFDLVLDSLQFEGMHEVMFERLLMARSSVMGAEPVTGEVSIAELEDADQAAAETSAGDVQSGEWESPTGFSGEAISAPSPNPFESVEDVAESTQDNSAFSSHDSFAEAEEADFASDTPMFSSDVSSADSDFVASEPTPGRDEPEVIAPAVPAKEAPRAVKAPTGAYPTRQYEPGQLPSPHSFGDIALTRQVLPAPWAPQPNVRPAAAQSSGLFDYGGPVPSPTQPPRPELDESFRVRSAPRPGAPWPRQVSPSVDEITSVPPMELLEQSPEQVAEHEEW